MSISRKKRPTSRKRPAGRVRSVPEKTKNGGAGRFRNTIYYVIGALKAKLLTDALHQDYCSPLTVGQTVREDCLLSVGQTGSVSV